MDWLAIARQALALPPATRDKIFQLIGLVEELDQDPAVKALIESIKPKA